MALSMMHQQHAGYPQEVRPPLRSLAMGISPKVDEEAHA